MSFWAEFFLGVIALATLTMASIQVAVIVYGWSVARRIERLLSQIDQQMAPITHNLQSIVRDAARISSVAVGQAERVDRLVTDLAERIEHTSTTVQNAILKPLRDGAALLAGFRAALGAVREITARPGGSRSSGTEDEDPLFIG